MPQDIPLEASDVLVFTPASLENIEGAPSFTLRACTQRDKRFHRRVMLECGLRYHDMDAIRAEMLKGLRAMWTPEAYEQHAPVVKELWEARDQFELQRKDEPELEWSYDPEIEAAVASLLEKVAQEWGPLCTMIADNADYSELTFPILNAVVVKEFTGLETPRDLDRGYLTVTTLERVAEELAAIEKRNGLPTGVAWLDLSIACSKRMRLDQDEEKNSESPSPSQTTQPASTETNPSEKVGKSKASARSAKTPVTA